MEEESVTSEGNRSMTFDDFGDIEALETGPGNLADHQQVPRSLKQALKSKTRKGHPKQLKTPPKLQLSKEIGFSVPTPPKPATEEEDLNMGLSRQGRQRKVPQRLADFEVTLASKPPTPKQVQTEVSDEPRRKRAREELEPEPASAGLAGFESMGELLQPSTRVRVK